jgi:hypothetical protein
MNVGRMAAIAIACQILISASPLSAQVDSNLLSGSEKRAFHACLYAHWIDGYCRFRTWTYTHVSFGDCVVANGGCECVLANNGYWGPDVDGACHALYTARRH